MAVTPEEKLEAVKGFDKLTTIDELREFWRKAYETVGHRALGRMLIGESPERALRLD